MNKVLKSLAMIASLITLTNSQAQSLDRIGVGGSGLGGQGYFYNKNTNQQVELRGTNYIRLATQAGRTYHSTFSVGYYNALAAEIMLNSLENDGYNTVRVFIDRGDWQTYNWDHSIAGDFATQQNLNPAYMDNVADFVNRATNHGIYVIPVLVGTPYNKFYFDKYVNSDPATYQTGNPNNSSSGPNAHYMTLGYYKAKKKYIKSFLRDLKARIGVQKMSTILALALENEAYFSTAYAPFNSMSGTVTLLNGIAYDMSIPADRQQAADANMVYWINGMRVATDRVDTEMLLTIGAFTFDAVGKTGANGMLPVGGSGDHRHPIRPNMVTTYSDIDFMDIHTYPIDRPTNNPYSLTVDLQSSQYNSVYGPVIMGEFGALVSEYPHIGVAGDHMKSHQIDSCGYNFKGWLFWTYDTTAAEQTDGPFHYLQETMGSINGQLAPLARPNPCTP